jgi:hypothetical protein
VNTQADVVPGHVKDVNLYLEARRRRIHLLGEAHGLADAVKRGDPTGVDHAIAAIADLKRKGY